MPKPGVGRGPAIRRPPRPSQFYLGGECRVKSFVSTTTPNLVSDRGYVAEQKMLVKIDQRRGARGRNSPTACGLAVFQRCQQMANILADISQNFLVRPIGGRG